MHEDRRRERSQARTRGLKMLVQGHAAGVFQNQQYLVANAFEVQGSDQGIIVEGGDDVVFVLQPGQVFE